MGSLHSKVKTRTHIKMQNSKQTKNMELLNEKQKNVLIGSLLGDLHIQQTLASTKKCRLRVCHSIKQKKFVDWKYSIFKKNFCESTKPPYIDKRKTKDGKNKIEYIFYTKCSKTFTEYRSLWYPEQTNKLFVKKIPINIADIFIDPLALAVWYLDDVTKRNDTNSCRIYTQSFSKHENLVLQNFFVSKTQKRYYSLAILSKNYHIFVDTIYDIVKTEIPSMLYKLE